MAGSSLECPDCGRDLKPGARFCTSCGRPVTFNVPSPATSRPADQQPTAAGLRQDFPPQASPPRRPAQGKPPDRSPRDSRRSRLPLPGLIGGSILVLGGVAAAVILTVHPFSHSETFRNAASSSGNSAHQSRSANTAAGGTSTPGSPVSAQSLPATGPSTATQVTEQQAAQSLSGMLSQSVSDRTAIVQAVSDIETCGSSLNQDPQVFESAASSRRTLLTQLANMPGASALPAPMLQDLTSAWQASIAADTDFAQWANDEITHGCVQNDTSDPGSVAANGPDAEATTDKQAFVGMWNPIATQYGLTTYAWNQL
jgi:zinc-ribbon domain